MASLSDFEKLLPTLSPGEKIYGCGESRDVAGVADLQAIQRLRGIRDLVGDTEIVIEKTHQSV